MCGDGMCVFFVWMRGVGVCGGVGVGEIKKEKEKKCEAKEQNAGLKRQKRKKK